MPIMSPPTSRRRWVVPTVLFLAALSVAAAMVAYGFRTQSLVHDKFDPYYFGAMGESLARGDGFSSYGVLLKRRSPLYPLIIGAVYALFGVHPLLVQLLQCACFAGTCGTKDRTFITASMGCRTTITITRSSGAAIRSRASDPTTRW